jgi:hypothetical protein
MDEWWNKVKKGALAASARTGKDVLVEACEASESDEESEGSDDESDGEGPQEECGAEAGGLTRGDLDKSLWPANKDTNTKSGCQLTFPDDMKYTGQEADVQRRVGEEVEHTSSRCRPSTETRFEERELLASARVFKHCTAFDAFCFVELTWSLSAFSLIYF